MITRRMIEISIDSLIEPVDPQRTVISSEGIEELARSIERVGIISPITVIPRGEKYEVVAGHRRYLAAKMTHLAIIPCIVMYPGEVDETETKIHENLYRENINSADEAEFYEKLITLKGLSIHEIAEKTGKSASYIRGRLDLLEGDPLVMEALRDDQINISVAQELNKIAMGKISPGKIDTNEKLYQPCKINLRIKRVNRILGQLLDKDESKTKNKIINILDKLEFKVVEDKGEYIEVIPPSFRGDVEREIDIIEEIVRIYGYDKIKPTLFNNTIAQEGKNFRFRVIDQAKETLIGCGLNEVITYSFISPDIFDRIRIPEGHKLRNAIKIKDPMTRDHSLMRTSLISSLLEVIKWNTNRQAELVKIFEVGKIYLPYPDKPNSLPQEKLIIAGAINKTGGGGIWEKSLSLDIFDIKGIIETVFQGLKVENWEVVPGNHPAFHPLRNGKIIMGGEEVGIFGEIHPEVINNYRIPGKVNLFEIDFENLLPNVPSDIKYCVLPKYPSVQRDLAMIVKEEILSADIIKTIKSIDEKLIKKVTLFDIFKGKQIGDGYKSLAYSVVFQAEDRTLTDQEVENTFKKIKEKLMVKFDAKIRE